MVATSIATDAQGLMADAMALSARVEAAEKAIHQAWAAPVPAKMEGVDWLTLAPTLIAGLRQELAKKTTALAELQAFRGSYAAGSPLVDAALAAAALLGDRPARGSYLAKRGWRVDANGGWEKAGTPYGVLSLDAALHIQSKADTAAVAELLK